MPDQNNAPERIWLRVTDKTVMARKPSDADEYDVEYIRADRAAPEGQDDARWLEVAEAFREWDACDDECEYGRVIEKVRAAYRAALTPPLHPAPADREALVRLLQIITRNGSLDDGRTLHEVIADALLASGLRLPGEAVAACEKIADEAIALSFQGAHRWSDLAAMIQKQNADLAAARAEIERLTKERDAQYDENVNRIAMQAKAEAERDAAMALLADACGAGTGGSVIESLLADAERDMRQRAADAAKAVAQAATIQAGRHPLQSRSHDDWMERDYGATMAAKAILALPLKHADREVGK